jgi:hypothetical protein
MNPFALPGVEDEHTYPLCPSKWKKHDSLYVDVDNIGQSFEQFQEHFQDPAIPMSEGRLILVVGGRHCGKTSLVNRCVYWLIGHLETKKITAVLVDLRTSGTDTEPVLIRTREAAQQTVNRVRAGKIVDATTLDALEKRLDQPRQIYSLISETMAPGVALLMLLPPAVDVLDEVVEYARSTHRGLFFFIESPHERLIEEQLVQVRQANATRPLTLRIGTLREEDGEKFVSKRLGNAADGQYPRMTQADMKLLTRDPRPIGSLQEALFQVYREREQSNDKYTPLDFVTYGDVTDAYFRWKTQQGYGRTVG